MQLYKVKLRFSKPVEFIEKKFYYSILWGVLNLVENNLEVYEDILKISYFFSKTDFFVILTIKGQKSFNFLVSKLMNLNTVLSVDSYKFVFKWIEFDFKVFDLDDLILKPVEEFEIKFLSPTQVRTQNKVFTLPVPERFLFSVYSKLKNLWLKLDIDEKDFKKWLWFAIVPKKFDLHTQVVEIKKALRSGVVWDISYVVYDKNPEYQKILDLILEAIPYVWIWSWVKLGLWNALFANKKLWK